MSDDVMWNSVGIIAPVSRPGRFSGVTFFGF